MDISWYTYFSWWIFIWFIIFKLGLTNFSPYLIYFFVIWFIALKFIKYIINYYKGNIKKLDILLCWFSLVLIIDIMPFFYLDKNVNKESILFTGILGLIYCLLMDSKNINIINHYSIENYKKFEQKFHLHNLLKNVFTT